MTLFLLSLIYIQESNIYLSHSLMSLLEDVNYIAELNSVLLIGSVLIDPSRGLDPVFSPNPVFKKVHIVFSEG